MSATERILKALADVGPAWGHQIATAAGCTPQEVYKALDRQPGVHRVLLTLQYDGCRSRGARPGSVGGRRWAYFYAEQATKGGE